MNTPMCIIKSWFNHIIKYLKIFFKIKIIQKPNHYIAYRKENYHKIELSKLTFNHVYIVCYNLRFTYKKKCCCFKCYFKTNSLTSDSAY